MTRFRCITIDEAGAPTTRIVEARSRYHATLLLLAEGVTPTSITRDAPSLAERFNWSIQSNEDATLQDLAKLVASGFTIIEAAALIDSKSARRIASGASLGEVMADAGELPSWIGAALTLSACRDRQPLALLEIADDAATIACRRTAVSTARTETVLLAGAMATLIIAVGMINIIIGLAVAVTIIVALRHPYRALVGSMASLRHAEFLQVLARLMTEGGLPCESTRIAVSASLTRREAATIETALAVRCVDADLFAKIGPWLGLSSVNGAILVHGKPANAARVVSHHLARSSMPSLHAASIIMRALVTVTTALVLLWLALQ